MVKTREITSSYILKGKAKAPKAGKKAAKKAEGKKATAEKVAGKPPKEGSKITLSQLADSYLRHLETKGKSTSTVMSYGIDLKLAQTVLGKDTQVKSLTPKKVQEYFDSDRVVKTLKGKPKAMPGIDKTRRVLRLALKWLEEVGVLQKAPLPEKAKKADKASKK
jgi:hypothetical protein